MNKIERLLKSQKVVGTGDEFDMRMNGLFDKPPSRRPPMYRRGIAPWQALAISLITGGFGYWLGHTPALPLFEETAPENVTMMYFIEMPSGKIGNTFDMVPAVEPFYKPPSPPISVVLTVSQDDATTDQPI